LIPIGILIYKLQKDKPALSREWVPLLFQEYGIECPYQEDVGSYILMDVFEGV